MKLVWSSFLCLLGIHVATAFKGLFKPPEDRPSILGFITKPKLPGINIQLGSHLGGGSFGFGFGFGGQFAPTGHGGNGPPHDKGHGRPHHPDHSWEEEKKGKFGPRPNWGEDKGGYPKPGPHDYDNEEYPKHGGYPKPGPYDYDKEEHPKPGFHEDKKHGPHESKKDFPKPGHFDENKEHPKRENKDPLPAWEDIGEDDSKSERLMEGDLVGDELIQPRLNRRRNKRYIESRIFHVPLLFQSNAKPYGVKIQSGPNRLKKRYSGS